MQALKQAAREGNAAKIEAIRETFALSASEALSEVVAEVAAEATNDVAPEPIAEKVGQ
jgi:hypothetical protein